MSFPLQAYLTLCGVPDDETRRKTANDPSDGDRLFRFSFGAYGETRVDVFADDFESAFEVAVEWLDDNAPGHLVAIGEAELREAADELGLEWEPGTPFHEIDEDTQTSIVANAETDLTVIGHTTLKHGQYLCSWEWTVDEVSP